MSLWASPNPEFEGNPVIIERLPAVSTFFQPLAVLTDSTSVAPFSSPTGNCSAAGSLCFSYVFPGTMLQALLVTNYFEDGAPQEGIPVYTAFNNASKDSTQFILMNASAYQLDYYPVQQPNIAFNATDCVTLAWDGENEPGLNLCAKDVGGDLVAGEISHRFCAHPRYVGLRWHPLLRRLGNGSWTIGFCSSTSRLLSSTHNGIQSRKLHCATDQSH